MMDRALLRMTHHFRPYGHPTPGVRSRIGVALEEMRKRNHHFRTGCRLPSAHRLVAGLPQSDAPRRRGGDGPDVQQRVGTPRALSIAACSTGCIQRSSTSHSSVTRFSATTPLEQTHLKDYHADMVEIV